tara:strand:+ start:4294 stop:4860 length:567 start_codon:yes stop_codon:yes gene_type:complete
MASKNFLIKKGLTVGDSDLHVSNNRASVKNLTVGNVEFPNTIGNNDQILRVSGGTLGFGTISSDAVIGNAGFDSDQIVSILGENHSKIDSDRIVSIVNENATTAIAGSVSTSIETFKFTATAGQTSFSGNDTNGNNFSYNVGSIQVFLNGIRLDTTDFTASNGSSIILIDPASLDNELIIDHFKVIIS